VCDEEKIERCDVIGGEKSRMMTARLDGLNVFAKGRGCKYIRFHRPWRHFLDIEYVCGMNDCIHIIQMML